MQIDQDFSVKMITCKVFRKRNINNSCNPVIIWFNIKLVSLAKKNKLFKEEQEN